MAFVVKKIVCMKEKESKCIYMPYTMITNSTLINGIKVWDRRWYINWWCKINWFFHFKERKRWKEISSKQVGCRYALDLPTLTGSVADRFEENRIKLASEPHTVDFIDKVEKEREIINEQYKNEKRRA